MYLLKSVLKRKCKSCKKVTNWEQQQAIGKEIERNTWARYIPYMATELRYLEDFQNIVETERFRILKDGDCGYINIYGREEDRFYSAEEISRIEGIETYIIECIKLYLYCLEKNHLLDYHYLYIAIDLEKFYQENKIVVNTYEPLCITNKTIGDLTVVQEQRQASSLACVTQFFMEYLYYHFHDVIWSQKEIQFIIEVLEYKLKQKSIF